MFISKRSLSPCGTNSIAPPRIGKPGVSPTVRMGSNSIAGCRPANCASCSEPTKSRCVACASCPEAIRLTTIARPLTLRSLTRRCNASVQGESPSTPITIGAPASAKLCAGHSMNLVKLYRNAALISYSLAGPPEAASAPAAFSGSPINASACRTTATATMWLLRGRAGCSSPIVDRRSEGPGKLGVDTAPDLRGIHAGPGVVILQVEVFEQVLPHHTQFHALYRSPAEARVEPRVGRHLIRQQTANKPQACIPGQAVGQIHT